MNIKLLQQLPECILNKIFYFLRLHPVAIAFMKDYITHENILTLKDCNNFRRTKRILFKTFFLYEKIDYNTDNYIGWSNNDIKPFVIIDRIIHMRYYNIINLFFERYREYKLCNKCRNNIIFNKLDKYCSTCIKKIKLEYENLPLIK